MKKFTQYKAVKTYLFKQLPMYQRTGPKAFKKDLKNIKWLLKKLGNPHKNFPTVHIAGTNGKGSTTHFLASILIANGLKVGMYTSPHYLTMRERIKIGSQRIKKKQVVAFANKLIKLGVFDQDQYQVSFFELSVAMAFDHFSTEQPDIAIIETGLGGRLDSTNVIKPLLSVITNIGLDHTQFLGETYELIAGEKAGIIKRYTPVIIGKRQSNCAYVFDNKAKSVSAPIIYAEDRMTIHLEFESIHNSTVLLQLDDKITRFKSIVLPKYQEENLRTAIVAAAHLSTMYDQIEIDQLRLKRAFKKVINQVRFYGRFQVLDQLPFTLADSAHNAEGVEALFSQLSKMRFEKYHIVYGTVNDKKLDMVMDLLPDEANYYLCKADVPRALDQNTLLEVFQKKKKNAKAYKSVLRALKAAKIKAEPNDLVLVTGSIFVVAEVL